ncbi:MAG: hypothetical protein ATN31_05490 [Candidatus Epulonipiscioides saccharophilum]|nr:MAG: hypothetical protein ATN31_05490 [Epulopiscium sp. AS2M-Bin001]
MVENISNTKINYYTYFPTAIQNYIPINSNLSENLAPAHDISLNQLDNNYLNYEKVFDQSNETLQNLNNLNPDLLSLDIADLPINEYKYTIKNTNAFSKNNPYNEEDQLLEDKIRRIKQHTDGMYKTALHDEVITLNSLYIGSYSQSDQSIFSNKAIDTKKVLELNQLPITSGNTWAAQKLMDIGEDVSPKNVAKMQNIYTAVEMMDIPDTSKTEEENMKTSPDSHNPNMALIQDNQMMYTEMDMQQIVDRLTNVSDDQLTELIISEQPLTIHTLSAAAKSISLSNEQKETLHINTNLILNSTSSLNKSLASTIPIESSNSMTDYLDSEALLYSTEEISDSPETDSLDSNLVTKLTSTSVSEQNYELKNFSFPNLDAQINDIRSQIEIIRAHLTLDAARNISEKLPLESTEISKIALELISYRDNQIETTLKNINLEPTPDNKESISQTLGVVTRMKYNKDASLVIQLQTNESAPLADFDNILSKYNEHALTPRLYFGESINIVKPKIEQFLQTNNIEVTPLSVQASTALIANNSEINIDSLADTMVIASKMNTFLSEMTPEIVASMIKEGINPYNNTIDSSLNFIAQKKLPAMQKTFAQSIVALEEKGQINQLQKDELIAIFQVLNKITKNQEAIAGYMQKNKLELTMSNLHAAIKNISPGTVDQVVDDLFGEIEGFKFADNTAKKRINSTHMSNQKLSDIAKIIQNTKLTDMNEPNLSTKIASTIFPFVKSALKKELGKFSNFDTLPDSFKEKLDVAQHASSSVLNALADKEIPITINNIYLMDKFINHPNKFADALAQELANGLAQESAEQLTNGLSQNFAEQFTNGLSPDSTERLANGLSQESAEKLANELFHNSANGLANESSKGLFQEDYFPESFDELADDLKNAANHLEDNAFNSMSNGDTDNFNHNHNLQEMTSFLEKLNKVGDSFQIPIVLNGVPKMVNLFINNHENNPELKTAAVNYNTSNLGQIIANIHLSADKIGYEIITSSNFASEKLSSANNSLISRIQDLGFTVSQSEFTSLESSEDSDSISITDDSVLAEEILDEQDSMINVII